MTETEIKLTKCETCGVQSGDFPSSSMDRVLLQITSDEFHKTIPEYCPQMQYEELMDFVLSIHYAYLLAKKILLEKQDAK